MTAPEPVPVVAERGREALRILSEPGVVTAAEAIAQALLSGEIPVPETRDG